VDAPPRRTFTFDEARQLLPVVRDRTREALERLGALEVPDDGDPGERRARLQELAAAVLAAWAEELEALGLEVKGPWLVDFDSGGGYYCWKWPEESLEYFHGYQEGFAGRVRLQ